MKRILVTLAFGLLLLGAGCGKNLSPTALGPATLVVAFPTSTPQPSASPTPSPTVTATPQPSLGISWAGLPIAQDVGSNPCTLTALQVILTAYGQEPVSVNALTFAVQGSNATALATGSEAYNLFQETAADDPGGNGNLTVPSGGYPPIYPALWSIGNFNVTENIVQFSEGNTSLPGHPVGGSIMTLTPNQPQTVLLELSFGTAVGTSLTAFLSAEDVQAAGVSTGRPASIFGGVITGNPISF